MELEEFRKRLNEMTKKFPLKRIELLEELNENRDSDYYLSTIKKISEKNRNVPFFTIFNCQSFSHFEG